MEEKYKIHAGYLVSIFLFIIIVLITTKWSAIPNLGGYLTFALTVTSLVLSVVAIFYTIYSNAGLAGKLTELSSVSQQLSNVAGALSEAAKEIREKAESIPPALRDVGAKVEQAQLLMKAFSEADARPTKEKGEQKEPKQGHEGLVDQIVSRASLNGLVALYAFSIAFKKKAGFNLGDLCSKLQLIERPYVHGYLVATSGTGLVGMTTNNDIFNVVAFDESLAGKVKADLDKRVSAWKDPKTKELFQKNIATIDAYFGIQN